MRFSGKRVLVTGGTRGIGRATVEAFLAEGARVAVNGRTAESVAKAVAELGHDGVIAAAGDVGEVTACEDIVGRAIDGLGGLDVLVNNAGVHRSASIEESDEALWERIMDVNVKGTFFCTRAAVAALKASKGNIVNVASESGLAGYADQPVYCTSKGAVVNMTRALAMALAPEVRVNSVCPGVVDTDMSRVAWNAADDPAASRRDDEEFYPLKRVATAEEVAQAILYLASDDARFVTGVALPLEGGSTAGRIEAD